MRLTVESFILNSRRIHRVLNHLGAHLDDELRLKQLADVACCTPSHLIRLYTRKINETPMATLRRLRLKRAHEALRLGKQRVLDIAQDAGYASNAAFTHAFVRQFGHPPTQFPAVEPTRQGIVSLRLVRSTEEQLVHLPYSGRHSEYWHSAHELVGRAAVSGGRRWRLWHALDEDAPLAMADSRHVRMATIIPALYLPADVPGADHTVMRAQYYAVFDIFGNVMPSIPALATRIEAETSCRLVEGLRHVREVKVSGYTTPSERHTELWLPVAARNTAGERALRQLRSTPPLALTPG